MVVSLLIELSGTMIASLVDYLLYVQQGIFEIEIMCHSNLLAQRMC